MRKTAILLSGLLFLAGFGLAQGDTEINLAQTEAGEHLVNVDGQPLYLFLPDDQRTSTCVGECLDDWQPLELVGGIRMGDGVQVMLIGTIELEDGTIQVTYNQWPLYLYTGDADDGSTQLGHALDDAWYLVSGDGTPVGLEE